MLKLSAVAACAAFLLGSSAVASASPTPNYGPGSRWHGYQYLCINFRSANPSDPKSHQVVIALYVSTAQAWVYDPATGGLTTLTPMPQKNLSPIPSIGVVIKKNPGGSAERMAPDATGGVFAFPATMEVGNYDIVITTPAHAVNTKGTGGVQGRVMATKPATITFHVTVGSKVPRDSSWRGITLDTSHPPTVVIGSGASSSQ